MNIFDFFKPKNKKNIVIPSTTPGPLTGAELIRAFSTEDEPKVKDFPKEQYKAYWEVFINSIPGGYGAKVKFYDFKTNVVIKEQDIVHQNLQDVRQEVSKLILDTMEANKR